MIIYFLYVKGCLRPQYYGLHYNRGLLDHNVWSGCGINTDCHNGDDKSYCKDYLIYGYIYSVWQLSASLNLSIEYKGVPVQADHYQHA